VIYQNHKTNSLLENPKGIIWANKVREIDLITYNFNPHSPFAKGEWKYPYIYYITKLS
jgi:hypothetical protein